MNPKFKSFKYWGSAVVILAVLIASGIKIYKTHQRRAKADTYEFIADTFLEKTDVDADQDRLEHVEFYGLVANYEPKWMVNTFNLDTDTGDTYIVAFNANGDDFRASYSVTWYKADLRKSIDDMMEVCRKELKKQYKGSDVVTNFTETIPDMAMGRQGKSLDYSARLGTYIINKRLTIFRENGYEFRIERASDISRESLDSYFDDLEFRIKIDGITR